MEGYMSIKAGENQVVVAGGQESMSQSVHAIQFRNGVKIGDSRLIDTLIFDGLTDAFHGIHMGITGMRIIILFITIFCKKFFYYIQSFYKYS